MTDRETARRELAALVGGFRARVEWLGERGVSGLPGGRSPRGLAGDLPSMEIAGDNAPAEAAPAETDNAPAETAGSIAPTETARRIAPAAADDPSGQEPAIEQEGDGAPAAPEVEDPADRLEALRQRLGECQRCRLGGERQHLVFGVGSPTADLLFIGEAPGRDEDRAGEPFVGAAGQLLTKMIEAMGLSREEVYIANIIKCRPPKNRDPAPDEVDACEPFLRRQIEIIAPRLIVALGNFAARTLLRTETGITRLRGRFHTYQGIPLMPTFHPAYLLRNPEGKRPVWMDLKCVMAEMDRLGLQRRRS